MVQTNSYTPKGFASITPYLAIRGANLAIAFYQRVFDAKEHYRLPGPGGKSVGHAELEIGGSVIMVSDEFPEDGVYSPKSLNGTPVRLCIYVEDADATVKRAIDAGATLITSVSDTFYGDRSGCIVDPFGHVWTIATHKVQISVEEMKKALAAEYSKK